MFDTSDTIAAIASARGGAMRGIIRVSGLAALSCLKHSFSLHPSISAETRGGDSRTPCVVSGSFETAPPIGRIPCDVYLWPTDRSYTRQPCFEIHTMGSPPILDALLSTICQSGARLAQPGEFTMRAFLAGRIDLTQAEAVLGVIDARDANELQVALQQLAGGLVRPLHDLRDRLLDLLARLEAGLDFVEEDIEFVEAAEVQSELNRAHAMIADLHAQISNRSHPLATARIVIRGWPNVGKSSLFNALAGSQVAIVSEQSGTTRDYVSCTLDFGGTSIQLLDTAGIEQESEGIAHAAQQVTSQQTRDASLQLFCLDASRTLNEWEREELARSNEVRIVVLTKTDSPRRCEFSGPVVRTSSEASTGIDELRRAIEKALERVRPVGMCIDSTAARCEESLRLAAEAIERGKEILTADGGEELIAAELRLALHELGCMAGTVYTDDILDRIFSRFCIGK